MTNEQKYSLVKKAYDNAYAKYSHFQVGALLILNDDSFYLGANIENASYGLTNCAERTALFSAYANGVRKDDIKELVILGKGDKFLFPCGACRQVIIELMPEKATITLMNLKKDVKQILVQDLLPYAFNEDDLYE